MNANTQNISEATIALIDSLKSTTSHFGLANSGSEYKIITEMFLYKYFNDKFGYEAMTNLRKKKSKICSAIFLHQFLCLNQSIHWRICIIPPEVEIFLHAWMLH